MHIIIFLQKLNWPKELIYFRNDDLFFYEIMGTATVAMPPDLNIYKMS